jgi:hypothetical protein
MRPLSPIKPLSPIGLWADVWREPFINVSLDEFEKYLRLRVSRPLFAAGIANTTHYLQPNDEVEESNKNSIQTKGGRECIQRISFASTIWPRIRPSLSDRRHDSSFSTLF